MRQIWQLFNQIKQDQVTNFTFVIAILVKYFTLINIDYGNNGWLLVREYAPIVGCSVNLCCS